jgi:hypothetical protein
MLLYLTLINIKEDKDRLAKGCYLYSKRMIYTANSMPNHIYVLVYSVQNARVLLAKNVNKVKKVKLQRTEADPHDIPVRICSEEKYAHIVNCINWDEDNRQTSDSRSDQYSGCVGSVSNFIDLSVNKNNGLQIN